MGGSSEKETPAPRDRDFDKEGLRNLEKLGGGGPDRRAGVGSRGRGIRSSISEF